MSCSTLRRSIRLRGSGRVSDGRASEGIEGAADGAGAAGRFIFDISRFYLEFHQSLHGELQCPVHDSSAVAFLLRPRLFKTVEGSVRVVTGGVAMGQTILGEPGRRYESDAWDGLATCRVCTAVDAAGLLAMYQETLGLASD